MHSGILLCMIQTPNYLYEDRYVAYSKFNHLNMVKIQVDINL